MNEHEAAELISQAAQSMGADVYGPDAWGDRNSDAYAIVPSTGNGLVMVRTDDVMESWEMVAYAYRTTERVTRASQIMPALMEDDGASIDPVSWGAAPGGPDDNTADDIETAIIDALGKADDAEEAYELRDQVAALLPMGLTADVIPQPDGEEFVAVLIADASDVATVVRMDGVVSVEGLEDQPVEFPTVADAVRAVLAAR